MLKQFGAYAVAFLILLVLLVAIITGVNHWKSTPTASAPQAGHTAEPTPKVDPNQALQAQMAKLEEQIAQRSKTATTAALTSRLQQLEKQLPQTITALQQRIAELPTQQLQSAQGTLQIDKKDTRWSLTNLFSKTRVYRQKINFTPPFAHTPQVMVGLQGLQLGQKKLSSLEVAAQKVTAQSFELVVTTQSDQRMEQLSMGWMALGKTVQK
ncbi:H-type lectin domain-containing protein [Magnetococcus sp. PR-3]|uniref:H-type lectin domain-containing protein n=1 Tax=Magnetococcus sp. PR-3 TaxID=3120355 RepID=UPI002FCDE7B6